MLCCAEGTKKDCTALDGCHHDAGHQGKKRTESLISVQFWWPGVYEDVNSPYGPDDGNYSTPLVHLDFTSFKTTTNLNESPKVEHVLVIVDHFMRYTRAYVTKDQKVSTAAKTL